MENRFLSLVRSSAAPIPVPISTHPGLPLTGARVVDVLSNPRAQVDTQFALHERLRTPVLLSAMDLSAEAEAFGCEIRLSGNEVPGVVRPLLTSEDDVRKLAVPVPGDKRTAVHLASVRMMRDAASGHRNFVPSSGCDLPPGTPLANLEAFYEAVRAAGE